MNLSKNFIYMPNIKATREPIFLIPNAKKLFNYLKQAFIEALISQHYNLKSHIQIKTNILDYNINKVLCQ